MDKYKSLQLTPHDQACLYCKNSHSDIVAKRAPTTHRALVNQAPGVAKVVDGYSVAPLRPDYMLVKVKAIALNPTDWKALFTLPETNGCVVGVDYAGVAEEVAEGQANKLWQKGDRIAGGVHGGEHPRMKPELNLLTRT